jgi:uncharacterized membrane protein
MQPFLLLVAVFALLVIPLGWWNALRIALALMFLFTASAHWGGRRADLVRMVPAAFPRPDVMVTVTGVLEIVGAVGLLVAPLAPYTAIGLTLLLVAIFPANVRAAQRQLTIGGRAATPLALRAVIQLIFLAATLAVAVGKTTHGFIP